MIDLILLTEYDELCKQVSPEGQMECLNRVFASNKFPARQPLGSPENELRVARFLKCIVEELRKEV